MNFETRYYHYTLAIYNYLVHWIINFCRFTIVKFHHFHSIRLRGKIRPRSRFNIICTISIKIKLTLNESLILLFFFSFILRVFLIIYRNTLHLFKITKCKDVFQCKLFCLIYPNLLWWSWHFQRLIIAMTTIIAMKMTNDPTENPTIGIIWPACSMQSAPW